MVVLGQFCEPRLTRQLSSSRLRAGECQALREVTMSPDAWIIEELEKEKEQHERPSGGLELELPFERVHVEVEAEREERVVVLDISPSSPNEIKI